MMKYSLIFFFPFLVSCAPSPEQEPREVVITGAGLHSNLPETDGFDLVQSKCMVCHSLRYIETQPAMDQKSWKKIVDKMDKAFGAGLDSASSARIVGYLTTLKK